MLLERSTVPGRLTCGVVVYVLLLASVCLARPSGLERVNVRVVTDEVDAVLFILAKRSAKQTVTEADWQRIFSSEGYIRLKKREAAMQRVFEDADFKTFVLSDALLERRQALAETLDQLKRADVNKAARRALLYLPKEARIKAKIYPVIKPRENSFVFDLETDPAIFLYLDPTKSKEKFENTLAHELHHIGYGSSCPSKSTIEGISRLPQNIRHILTWTRAFGEGFAMLAAAGGPENHPHAASNAEERARWDKDVANFNDDFRKVEKFYLDILEDKFKTEDEMQKVASSFYGVQGPWYTVGWKMAVVIEKSYGRKRLIECMCDQRKLLSTYNRAAAKYNRSARVPLAVWSLSLIRALDGEQNRKASETR
ncbi:MAG TPA: DUF5700 domain-containing putative Zn-dependent protease [Pyrinomonadaceae bacterium]|jgi:hypothetical protein